MKHTQGALRQLLLAIACVCLLLPITKVQAASPCSLCIIEVQTIGSTGDEAEDFVILANNTAASQAPTNLRLQYLNSAGILDSSISPGSFAPNEVKIFVSSALKPLNQDANSTTLNLPLAHSGGSLRLVRLQSSTSSTIITTYDQLSWGSAVQLEGQPLAASNGSFVRKQFAGAYQDSNDNQTDFDNVAPDCLGVHIQEVQPYVTDGNGEAIHAWVELQSEANSSTNCWLATDSGDRYGVPDEMVPPASSLGVVEEALDASNTLQPLHLGAPNGQVWLTGRSSYGGNSAVYVPTSTANYTNISKGQSWALIDDSWRRTYALTPGAINQYLAAAPSGIDDPAACNSVRISELLPNPSGDDAEKEWLEIANGADTPVSLAQCQVSINGTVYLFLPDDVLAARQILATNGLYSADGDDKTLSLSNAGPVLVALQRLRADGSTETVQSFSYENAPEGQSWARFDDGWAWTYLPTFGTDNVLQTTPPEIQVTETPIPPVNQPATDLTTASLMITELLPNPAPPLSDGSDEFVELYNNGAESVDLTGYKVQVGSSFSYSYTFNNRLIEPNGYVVITSGDTPISLANGGGKARLVAPDGSVVFETEAYPSAPEGQAWAFVNGSWQWTTSPTPAAANIFVAPMGAGAVKSAKTTTKTAKTSIAKPKTTTSSAKTSKSNTPANDAGGEAPPQIAPLHTSVVAGVGGLALLYAGYEYRLDAANRLYQFRRYRAARRAARAATSGR